MVDIITVLILFLHDILNTSKLIPPLFRLESFLYSIGWWLQYLIVRIVTILLVLPQSVTVYRRAKGGICVLS